MTERVGDDRAPLDFGTGSKLSKLIGCPNCKTFKSRLKTCIGFVCSQCGKYVGEKDFLLEFDVQRVDGKIVIDKVTLSKEYLKLRKEAEEKAYDYKDKVDREKNK